METCADLNLSSAVSLEGEAAGGGEEERRWGGGASADHSEPKGTLSQM